MHGPQEERPMKITRPFCLAIACATLLAACASVKEVGPTPMSCEGCKAATDSLKSARAAAREALRTDDKEKLKAALQEADVQMAKMEGHKDKCMAMMKESGKSDTAAAVATPADDGHAKHH